VIATPASAVVATVIASARMLSRKRVMAVAPFVWVRRLGATPVLPYEGNHNSAVFSGYERSAVAAIFRRPDQLRLWVASGRSGMYTLARRAGSVRLHAPAYPYNSI
jgi:hypothetical protein